MWRQGISSRSPADVFSSFWAFLSLLATSSRLCAGAWEGRDEKHYSVSKLPTDSSVRLSKSDYSDIRYFNSIVQVKGLFLGLEMPHLIEGCTHTQ